VGTSQLRTWLPIAHFSFRVISGIVTSTRHGGSSRVSTRRSYTVGIGQPNDAQAQSFPSFRGFRQFEGVAHRSGLADVPRSQTFRRKETPLLSPPRRLLRSSLLPKALWSGRIEAARQVLDRSHKKPTQRQSTSADREFPLQALSAYIASSGADECW